MLFSELNETQKGEVMRHIGNPKGISEEGIDYAIGQYLASLQEQVRAAKEIFFGRLEEGLKRFLQLPEDVCSQIDQLVWDAAKGQPIDATEPASQSLIAGAILHSLEHRMGMHEA